MTTNLLPGSRQQPYGTEEFGPMSKTRTNYDYTTQPRYRLDLDLNLDPKTTGIKANKQRTTNKEPQQQSTSPHHQ